MLLTFASCSGTKPSTAETAIDEITEQSEKHQMTYDDLRAIAKKKSQITIEDFAPFKSVATEDTYSPWHPVTTYIVDAHYAVLVSHQSDLAYDKMSQFMLVTREAPHHWYNVCNLMVDDVDDFFVEIPDGGKLLSIMSSEKIDRYVTLLTSEGVTLLDQKKRVLFTASSVVPFPNVIAVREHEGGRYKMYSKDNLLPVSDEEWDEVFCNVNPDSFPADFRMIVRRNGYCGLIDSFGNTILLPETHRLTDVFLNIYEGVWPIIEVLREDRYGAIDYQGNMVIEPKWEGIWMDVYNSNANGVVVYDGTYLGGLRIAVDGAWGKASLISLEVDYCIGDDWFLGASRDSVCSMFEFRKESSYYTDRLNQAVESYEHHSGPVDKSFYIACC